MSDVPPDIGWTLVKGLWTVLMTLLGFFGVRALNKVEKNSEDIARLRTQVVGKDEFDAYKEERREAHNELRQSLTEAMDNAVARVENSNRLVMDQFQETQNIILQKLLD